MTLRDRVALLSSVALVAAALGVGAAGALESVHESWTAVYGPFAHGYVILALAVMLAWRIWQRDPPRYFAPWWPPLIVLGGAVAVLWVMEVLFLNSARQVLVPVMIWSALASVLGRHAGRVMFWPVAFLYFALPQWWIINAALQQLTAKVANVLVAVTGVPAYVEGNSFNLPAGVVEVANGCSGLNYLVVALALALFQGLSYLATWRLRWKLLCAAAAVGLLSNWLRVYLLILIGYATDMQHYLIRVDHLYFGWVLFLVCMWPVFVYAARLEHSQAQPAVEPSLLTGGTRAAVSQLSPVSVATAVLMLLAPVLVGRVAQGDTVGSPVVPVSWPAGSGGDALVAFHHDMVVASWVHEGEEVAFGRLLLPVQTRERHLSGDPTEVFAGPADGAGWRVAGRAGHYSELIGVVGGTELRARVGYTVAGSPIAGAGWRFRWAQLRGALEGRRNAAVWVVVSRCEPDCETAGHRLDGFLADRAGLL